jgi:hypothetical protein
MEHIFITMHRPQPLPLPASSVGATTIAHSGKLLTGEFQLVKCVDYKASQDI